MVACDGVALLTVVFSSAFCVLWSIQTNNEIMPDTETLFQLKTFNTFCSGKYDGYLSYRELAEHGDFGIGTFDKLDGEMIAVDRVFYQIPFDGNPKQVDPNMTAPYATVTFFDADETKTLIGPVNYSEIQTNILSFMPKKNAIYAIKISGNCLYAQTRSVHAQTKPYPIIADVVKNQSVFDLTNVSATAVGFWFPSSMDGIDYAGFHFHLITDDHSAGGHLLEFIIENATIEIDQINNFNLILP
ncbi:MAG: acetolactate decarboxylase [Candidatus Bathyarchaeota archaeon]|nr:MAG: acetolactate decarboxylase [Candidatus Bathyarchaeota archaeon]